MGVSTQPCKGEAIIQLWRPVAQWAWIPGLNVARVREGGGESSLASPTTSFTPSEEAPQG